MGIHGSTGGPDMEKIQAQKELAEGKIVLGIELGSTRIKSVLIV